MSQPASRTSSLGTTSRRGQQKAHIPFRGDDLEHGKKTGKTVNKVSRDADDFEPFQDVLDQAYSGGNAPRAPNNISKVVNGKSHYGTSAMLEDRDDNGELSMEIDSAHNSPSAYFSSTIAPHTQLYSRGNVSFTELARTHDDEIDNPDDDQSLTFSRADKGKRKEEVREDSDENDVGIEDDIATGLQEIEDERISEDEDREEEPGPSSKKQRDENHTARNPESKKAPKKPIPKRTKEQHRLSIRETTNQEGLRRSQRRHYPPLEYWRQEKVVWGRREKGPDKGPSYVPVIKKIITIPKPPPQPLGAKKRKRAGTQALRSHSKSAAPESHTKDEVRVVEVDNPELGWDDETPSHGIIVDFDEGEEVQRRVAFTAKMVKPVPAGNSNYLFQKIFGDGDFIAGGQLVIPPGEEKPAKPTKDNTYIFYLIQGAVKFRVHRSTFILATGGMFLVPRGNQYYIENICQRDAKLFFAQARKIVRGDQAFNLEQRASAPPRPRTAPRSPSHASSPRQHKDMTR